MLSAILDYWQPQSDNFFSPENIALFYRQIEDAKKFDKETGQSDCEDPDKLKLITRVEELEKQLTKAKLDQKIYELEIELAKLKVERGLL